MSGWIKLHRRILNSDMYKSLTSKQRDIMIVILLMVNFEKSEWEWNGDIFRCEPGQTITSIENIRKLCGPGVSRQNIKTALSKLKKWLFLTNISTNTGRLITILNWDTYQSTDDSINQPSNQQLTDNQPTANQQLTTNKNDKNLKKDIKKDKEPILVNSNIPYIEIIQKFHEKLPSLPKVKLTKRNEIYSEILKNNLKLVWNKKPEFRNIEFWENLFLEINNMPNLMGKNNRGWNATLVWIVDPGGKKEPFTNLEKILSGKYEKAKQENLYSDTTDQNIETGQQWLNRKRDGDERKR